MMTILCIFQEFDIDEIISTTHNRVSLYESYVKCKALEKKKLFLLKRRFEIDIA